MRISAAAIYQYIYILPRGELKATLINGLRQEHKYRRTRKAGKEKVADGRGKISDMLSIEERPAEVADRTIPGHWEGDLILGKNKRGRIDNQNIQHMKCGLGPYTERQGHIKVGGQNLKYKMIEGKIGASNDFGYAWLQCLGFKSISRPAALRLILAVSRQSRLFPSGHSSEVNRYLVYPANEGWRTASDMGHSNYEPGIKDRGV